MKTTKILSLMIVLVLALAVAVPFVIAQEDICGTECAKTDQCVKSTCASKCKTVDDCLSSGKSEADCAKVYDSSGCGACEEKCTDEQCLTCLSVDGQPTDPWWRL